MVIRAAGVNQLWALPLSSVAEEGLKKKQGVILTCFLAEISYWLSSPRAFLFLGQHSPPSPLGEKQKKLFQGPSHSCSPGPWECKSHLL